MMRVRWNWTKLLFLAAVLAASGAGGFLTVRTTSPALGDEQIGPVPSPSDPTTAEDEKAIQKMQADYIKTFNAGDAKALAEFWAVDGEFVDADGKLFKGQKRHRQGVRVVFRRVEGAQAGNQHRFFTLRQSWRRSGVGKDTTHSGLRPRH